MQISAPAAAPYRAPTPSPHCVRWVRGWSSCARPTCPWIEGGGRLPLAAATTVQSYCRLVAGQALADWRSRPIATPVGRQRPRNGQETPGRRLMFRRAAIAAFGLVLLWTA